MGHNASAPVGPLDVNNSTLGAGDDLQLKDGECPDWAHGACSWLVAQALAQLTGIRATMPVTIVAWWSLLGDCPFHLAGLAGSLDTWPGCLALAAAAAVEVIIDMCPSLAQVQDVVLLFIKPIFGFLLAASIDDGMGMGDWRIVLHVAGSAGALVVAVMYGMSKTAVDDTSGGLSSAVRSLVETGALAVAAVLAILYVPVAVALSCVVAALILFVCCRLQSWRKERLGSQRKQRSSDVRGAPNGDDGASSAETSESEDADSPSHSLREAAPPGAGDVATDPIVAAVQRARSLPASVTVQELKQLPEGSSFMVPSGLLSRRGVREAFVSEAQQVGLSPRQRCQDLIRVTHEGLLVTTLSVQQLQVIESSELLQK